MMMFYNLIRKMFLISTNWCDKQDIKCDGCNDEKIVKCLCDIWLRVIRKWESRGKEESLREREIYIYRHRERERDRETDIYIYI